MAPLKSIPGFCKPTSRAFRLKTENSADKLTANHWGSHNLIKGNITFSQNVASFPEAEVPAPLAGSVRACFSAASGPEQRGSPRTLLAARISKRYLQNDPLSPCKSAQTFCLLQIVRNRVSDLLSLFDFCRQLANATFEANHRELLKTRFCPSSYQMSTALHWRAPGQTILPTIQTKIRSEPLSAISPDELKFEQLGRLFVKRLNTDVLIRANPTRRQIREVPCATHTENVVPLDHDVNGSGFEAAFDFLGQGPLLHSDLNVNLFVGLPPAAPGCRTLHDPAPLIEVTHLPHFTSLVKSALKTKRLSESLFGFRKLLSCFWSHLVKCILGNRRSTNPSVDTLSCSLDRSAQQLVFIQPSQDCHTQVSL